MIGQYIFLNFWHYCMNDVPWMIWKMVLYDLLVFQILNKNQPWRFSSHWVYNARDEAVYGLKSTDRASNSLDFERYLTAEQTVSSYICCFHMFVIVSLSTLHRERQILFKVALLRSYFPWKGIRNFAGWKTITSEIVWSNIKKKSPLS